MPCGATTQCLRDAGYSSSFFKFEEEMFKGCRLLKLFLLSLKKSVSWFLSTRPTRWIKGFLVIRMS